MFEIDSISGFCLKMIAKKIDIFGFRSMFLPICTVLRQNVYNFKEKEGFDFRKKGPNHLISTDKNPSTTS